MKPGPSPIPSRVVRAAGAVVWRRADLEPASPGQPMSADDLEVLVVHRPRYKDWSWPKGKAEHNEPLPLAAAREVEEETGLMVDLRAPLTTQRYRLGTGQTKEVFYWIGTPTRKQTYRRARRPVERATDQEIDRSSWLPVSRAMRLLTRRGDRRLLDEVVARAEAGTLVTTTICLLRHAKAVSRTHWQDGEDTRPLSRLGGRQALDAVDLLSAFGVDDVFTSPWARCANTVLPYAALAALHPAERLELTESAVDANPKAGRRFVERLLVRASGSVAVCVHRPTIPVLMQPLQAIADSRLVADFPTEPPWLSTAQMLVAHVAHPSLKRRAAVPNPAQVFGGGAPVPPKPGAPMLMALETHRTYTKLANPA